MKPAAPPGRIRLLVLDVDGTVTNSRHEVADTTRRAIDRARAAGVRVMLATGRRYRDALPVAERLAIVEPLVTASGALVKRPGDHATLERAAFRPGVLPEVLGIVIGMGHEPVVYSDSFAAYLARNRDVARVEPDLHRQPPAEAFAGFAMGGGEAMAALEARLVASFPGDLALHTILSPRYSEWLCEIAPAGVDKWTGVMSVAAGWGIAAEEICAVGDDVNDLPMVRAAGLGIAMGNARPVLQAAADQVVGTHDDSGIEDVVDLVLASASHPAPPPRSEGG
jgi:Cof subfamily protein (haloacid dehalogenase superfamily)